LLGHAGIITRRSETDYRRTCLPADPARWTHWSLPVSLPGFEEYLGWLSAGGGDGRRGLDSAAAASCKVLIGGLVERPHVTRRGW
jgi:hypothetical protein